MTMLVLVFPPGNVLSWDVFGYYLYLPAVLLHGDPGMQDHAWVRAAMDTYQSSATFYQAGQLPDGKWILKYPMGLAVLWSPFFVLGHIVAGIIGAPQDGFSAPYQWAIVVASLVYAAVGLWALRQVLLTVFTDRVTAWVLVLLVLGTNFLHQSVFALGMPHVVLFALYAGIMLHTVRWYAQHRLRDAVMLALLSGLAILSRPSDVLCLLLPVLFGLVHLSGWRTHLATLFRYRKQVVVAVIILFLIGLPQFAYYKWLTGRFLYLSYNNPGEGLELLYPHLWEVLFSFRKGWFIYTPVMAVAVVGMVLLRRSAPQWAWAVFVFFVLNLYVVSSWSCWWYADSFGQRALVQSYAVMALPLGALLMQLERMRKPFRWAVGMLFGSFVLLNIFQTYQTENGIIHTSRMTWDAYREVFLRTTKPEQLEAFLSVDRSYWTGQGDPDLSRYREVPYLRMGFELPEGRTLGHNLFDTTAFAGNGCFEITPDAPYSPTVESTWESLTGRDHLWVKVTCMVRYPLGERLPAKVALVTTFDHKGHSYMWKAATYEPAEERADTWVRMTHWYLTPEVRVPYDRLLIYAWLQEGSRALVDEMEVTLYEPITE
jgi:hypothetical protein